jgi:hypothetical protein
MASSGGKKGSHREPFFVVAATLIMLAFAAPAMAAPREFTYSIASRGPVHVDMAAFARTVATIYADPRGWSLYGSVRFRTVKHGGDLIVWLATPNAMSSFGAGCSAQWDCRSGRDVIINEARWEKGSPKWPGPLGDYRTMIVNHETGHWLGFDHATCPAVGAPAPIMMQQSKGVGACLPNPWPTQAERNTELRMLGFST